MRVLNDETRMDRAQQQSMRTASGDSTSTAFRAREAERSSGSLSFEVAERPYPIMAHPHNSALLRATPSFADLLKKPDDGAPADAGNKDKSDIRSERSPCGDQRSSAASSHYDKVLDRTLQATTRSDDVETLLGVEPRAATGPDDVFRALTTFVCCAVALLAWCTLLSMIPVIFVLKERW